jgi:threonine synthase
VITGLRCAVCDASVEIVQPFTWACPNAAPDDPHHLLEFVDDGVVEPVDTRTTEPIIRYRRRCAWWAFARANGMSDDDTLHIASTVAGGFATSPFGRHAALSAALGIDVWAKDETHSVAGSHKARHLIGIMLHLRVAETLGLLTERPALAISSCGNAALAAATIASSQGWPIRVFVPTWMDDAFGDGLDRLGAEVHRCERRDDGALGDPAMAGFRAAVADGAVPFSVQGPANAWCLDTGRTIGWEMAESLPDSGLEAVYVQIGGGALATCLSAGLGREVPLVAVQAQGCAPFAAAMERATHVTDPEHHWAEVMMPWSAPTSLADGILDDETYDWIGVRRSVLASRGRTVIAPESSIVAAASLVERTGPPTSPTGTAGLAGLMADLDEGFRPERPVAIVLSGVAR